MCMQVLPVRIYSDKFSCQKNNFNSTSPINFKGFDASTFLIMQVARNGYQALRSRKTSEFIRALEYGVDAPYSENFPNVVNALTKTPDALYSENKGWLYWLNDRLPHISELRIRALDNLSYINDNSRVNIQTKKDFIKSLFDNGNEVSVLLAEQISGLDNSIYKSFKEEILDICFFSRNYNRIRGSAPPYDSGSLIANDERRPYFVYCWLIDSLKEAGKYNPKEMTKKFEASYNNLKFLAYQDTYDFASYIRSRRGAINQCKNIILSTLRDVESSHSNDDYTKDVLQEFMDDYNENIRDI